MKILIADDEVNIVALIKSLIDYEAADVEAVWEAGDGLTALDMLRSLHPDVVITDIRMPGLSGIDLICQARSEKISVEFIIISGYSEFEYAKSAIQYGVSDYLLKPIKKKEINEVLAKLADRRASKSKILQEITRMEDRLAVNNSLLRKNLLQSLISQDETVFLQTLGRMKEEDIFRFTGSFYAVVAVKLDCASDPEYQIPEQAVETITAKIMRQLSQTCCETEFICRYSWGYICLNYEGGQNFLEKRCLELQEMLEKTEYKNDLFDITLGVGSQAGAAQGLFHSLETAKQAVMLRIDLGVGKAILFDRISENCRLEAFPLPGEFENRLERQIPLLIPGKLVLMGEEVLTKAVEGQYHYYRLYGLVREMLEKAEALFAATMKDYEIPETGKYIGRLERCISFGQLKEVWSDYINGCCDACRQQQAGMSSRPVRMIKEYIEAHYNENVTLNEIAEIVFLNPAYLSAMFKKETGQTFTQYIIDVRIEKAKKMLQAREKTIGEIACLVGYQDEKHFSKLFSRVTGVKPTEYRKFYS